MLGKRFGRLTVIGIGSRNRHGKQLLECKCDCGNIKEYIKGNLGRHSKSCGCFRKEMNRKKFIKHGDTGTRLYVIWVNMKYRCDNPNATYYEHYGGKGISVCKEWYDFSIFRKWAYENGYNDNLTIDRIDNNKHYGPSNCRWATMKEQANNKLNSVYIVIDDVSKSQQEWAKKVGIAHNVISRRLARGWTPKEAVFGKGLK